MLEPPRVTKSTDVMRESVKDMIALAANPEATPDQEAAAMTLAVTAGATANVCDRLDLLVELLTHQNEILARQTELLAGLDAFPGISR